MDAHSQPPPLTPSPDAGPAGADDPDALAVPVGRSVAQGVVLLSLGSAAAVVLGYVMHVVAGRWLPTASYGRFAIVLSVLVWAKQLQGSLVIPGLRKAVSEDPRRLGAALRVAGRWCSASAIVMLALFAAAAPLLGAAFGDAALVGLFLVGGIEIPFAVAMSVGQWLFNALRRYGSAFVIHLVHSAARAGAACTLILLGLGAMGAVAGLVAAALVAAVLAMGLILRERGRTPAVAYPAMARRAMFWSVASVPTAFGRTTLQAVDFWLVKVLMDDPAAAGLYGMAFAISRLPGMMVVGISAAVFPRVSGALAAGQPAVARSVAAEAVRLLTIVLAPTCFLIAGSASEIIALLFTARYATAGAALAMLTVAMSLYAYLSLMLGLLAAADRPYLRMAMVLAPLPVSAGLCVVLIGRFGLEGAAAASLITFALAAVAAVLSVWRLLGRVIAPWTLVRCVSAGAAVCVAGRFWPAAGAMLVVKLAVLGLAYLAALGLTGELRRGDLAKLKGTFLGRT